ncbi:MAG: methionine--tRNA ligase subunit beta [Candidatus Aenigmatarchaeota archaeon]|nr:methionine--tRNA ligase subunit beta [Candidatus Aenigmarchaeota archaeon]
MEVSFEDFKKLDIRIGKVKDVQDIKGSKNLIKLIVDFGDEERQAIAGLKNYYSKEDLVGKEFVFLLNLERRKFMGEESQCMILAADNENGKIVLLVPERYIDIGSRVR